MGRRDSTKSSKRKRDKISSKEKSRRKDKKKRRIGDSVITNAVDDLLISEHSPLPTLKSDHRKRINKKKKGRRHRDSSLSDYGSLSSESDSDNAYKGRKARRVQVGSKDGKKKKRLDRDRIVKPIKKISKKKFSKYSSSSSGSDSESRSRSSGSTADSLRRRSKVIPDKGIERRRGRAPHKAKKTHKVRSPSCSSFDTVIEPTISVSNSDEALFPTNNSRRLKSVIVVVDRSRDEVENRWEISPHKEEIVYDQKEADVNLKSVDDNENLAVVEAPELAKSGIDIGDLDKVGNHQSEGAHPNDSGGIILESILRQKALESLKKFKQRLQTSPRSTTVKKNDESDVGTLDTDQNKLIKEGISNTQELKKTSVVSSKGEIYLNEDEDKKLPDSAHFEKEQQSFDHPHKEVKELVECSEEGKSVNATSTMEPSSSVDPICGLDGGNEAKDGSQFQQKTMSVMRGGEQVQVSYKVYIPKKAPALARRHLRR